MGGDAVVRGRAAGRVGRGPALVVGLTGGIGSGKSAAAEVFEALGVPVVDADRVAREVVAPGEPALAAVVEAFGERVLAPDGALDRARLRRLVFADDGARRRLEAILHPAIRARLRERLEALDDPYAIVAIPLLVESGQRDLVDRILVVDVDPRTQVRRTARRDSATPAEVGRILAAQASREARLAAADDVLYNDGDLDTLARAVGELHERYRALALQRARER